MVRLSSGGGAAPATLRVARADDVHWSVRDWRKHAVSVVLEVNRVVAAERHSFDPICLLHSLQQSLRLLLVKDCAFFGLRREELLRVDGRHGARDDQTSMATLGLVPAEEHSGLLHLLELLLGIGHLRHYVGSLLTSQVRGGPHVHSVADDFIDLSKHVPGLDSVFRRRLRLLCADLA